MKIIHIGSQGTLGKHIAAELAKRHDIITVGRSSGQFSVDFANPQSLRDLFIQVKSFDAVICTAGDGYFGPFETMTISDFRRGIDGKLMGQINVVIESLPFINPGGSITLTSGILADDPVPMASNLSAINGAINAFVKAAAIEFTQGIRINAVSPGLVIDSAAELGSYFPGHIPVSMEHMVSGYVKAVEGKLHGQVIKIY